MDSYPLQERVALSFRRTAVSFQADAEARRITLVFEVEGAPILWEQSGEMLLRTNRPTTDLQKLAEARTILREVISAFNHWKQRIWRFVTCTPDPVVFSPERSHCDRGALVLEQVMIVSDQADYAQVAGIIRAVLAGPASYSGTYEGEFRSPRASARGSRDQDHADDATPPDPSRSEDSPADKASKAAARTLQQYLRWPRRSNP